MNRQMVCALATLLVTGCQSSVGVIGIAANRPGTTQTVAAQGAPFADGVILKGRVDLPAGFATKATSADLAAFATISMSAVGGNPVCAGLTDSTGNFTLYASTTPFVPVTGGFYKLDFVKRFNAGAFRNLLTLRTTVRWNGTGWDSVTGGTVMISPLTTAISRIEETDVNVQPADIMNVVTLSGTTATTAGFPGFTPTQIAAVEAMVVGALTNNRDPLGDWCPPPPPPPPPGAPTPPPPPPDCQPPQ